MKRSNGHAAGRSFSSEPSDGAEPGILDADAADAGSESSEVDYSFEGYTVEFIDKVALMPLTAAVTAPLRQRQEPSHG